VRNFYQTVTFSPIFKITKIAETVSNRWKLRSFMRVGTGLASLANKLHEPQRERVSKIKEVQ